MEAIGRKGAPEQAPTAPCGRGKGLAAALKRTTAVVFVATMALLLFARLGTYYLWDDEANTSLFGLGVWRTGDTSAVIDHNVKRSNAAIAHRA